MSRAEKPGPQRIERLYRGKTDLDAQLPYSLPDERLAVVKRDWLLVDGPELHLALNDGSVVKVTWSIDHACRFLFVASPGEDFLACTADQTGIEPDELDGYVDEVYRAAVAEECERLADNFDDGQGDEVAR